MSAYFIYITTSDADEAMKIGKTLVEEKLAACVNILPQMKSVYCWEGKVTTANEAVLIAKTTAKLVDKLEKRVGEIHSYSCPCIVAMAIDGGSAGFLKWIEDELK